MDNEKAKLILQAYRPNGADASDPLFAEALDQAQRDPELKQWFEQQRRFDAAISRQLAHVAAPKSLLPIILSGAPKHPMDIPRRRWFYHMAWAASILFLVTLTGLWLNRFSPSPTVDFVSYRQDMTRFLSRFYTLEQETRGWPGMKSWLRGQFASETLAIPRGLLESNGLGCRTIKWNGRLPVLACFKKDGQIVHLFILPASDLPDRPAAGSTEWRQLGRWTTASWQDGGMLYLAATRAKASFLSQLLERYQG